ncbi:MAG TPA: aminodeoxychorismate synthase component I [Pontiella sp.]
MLQEAEKSGLFAAGFISYEAAPAFDHALKTHSSDGFPLLCMGLFRAPDVLEEIEEVPSFAYEIGALSPSVSKDEFISAIGEIKNRIAEGATYQVNYTYRLSADFSGDAWAFFYELVKDQKTAHAAFIDTGDYAVCSASPELFFNLNNGKITARPMKGTARRGRTFVEDWDQAEALRHSEKDCAENIMIVDMIRNDIGRIAETGSVDTVSRYDVEKYPTVWQMTSTVTGNLPKKLKSAQDDGGIICEMMQALFPCASITGAPKAKTMEIIQELESSPRKIYTGSIGFITPQGDSSFNVAIRTALIDRKQGVLEFGVGGGIVWDSDAEDEYEETLTKARVLTQPRPDFLLLETMRWEPELGVFLLDEHLQRLGKSAAYFDIPLDVHDVFQNLDNVVQNLSPIIHRLRLVVSRDGTIEIEAIPEESVGSDISHPLQIEIAKEPVNSQNIFLFHKTTNRNVYESARADFPECDDVILWNEAGEITEGSIANVVIRRGARLVTPPVECGLLAGTFRAHLLKSCEIEEAVISKEEFLKANEIYLINSVRKWKRAVLNKPT